MDRELLFGIEMASDLGIERLKLVAAATDHAPTARRSDALNRIAAKGPAALDLFNEVLAQFKHVKDEGLLYAAHQSLRRGVASGTIPMFVLSKNTSEVSASYVRDRHTIRLSGSFSPTWSDHLENKLAAETGISVQSAKSMKSLKFRALLREIVSAVFEHLGAKKEKGYQVTFGDYTGKWPPTDGRLKFVIEADLRRGR